MTESSGPLVGVIMGSKSDFDTMRAAADVLAELDTEPDTAALHRRLAGLDPVQGGEQLRFLLLRGHDLPGGGFSAGLVVSIAFILQYMIGGADWVEAGTPLIKSAGISSPSVGHVVDIATFMVVNQYT